MKNIFSQILFCLSLCFFYSANSFAQVKDSMKIEIINVGSNVNSPNEEYAPVISADGSLLMFTTKRITSDKKKKKEAFEQIWFSEINAETKTWQSAMALSENINPPNRNSSNIALSNDGQKLLLYVDDLSGTGNIYESELKGSDWSDPIKLPAPINSDYHESSASYSPDRNIIYFVSDRLGGKGGRDIWSCEYKNGKWGRAVNLGTKVNSSEDEEAVFIHPDGKTLYFSSKKKGGFGGYDVYKTEFINRRWSIPQNMGEPINTKGGDLFFVMEANGKTAYYSSDQKGSMGGKDIFKIIFTSTSKKLESGPQLTILKGVISDEKTGELLASDIELIDNEKQEVIAKFKSNSTSGKYLISLPSGKNYGINVGANGYLFESENINLPDSAAFKEVIKNIALKKLEVGNKIVLHNIFFDYNEATLKAASKSELEKLTKLLAENKEINIEISGHTDNIGSAAYNQKLSEERAKAVVGYLVEQGIVSNRLHFKGYGFEQPIATNDTEEGRQQNRRTEFKIIEK